MTTYSLTGQIRPEAQKNNRKVRDSGMTPAVIYGKDFPSLSCMVDTVIFTGTLKAAGETSIIELTVGSKKYPVLIHRIQRHPVSGHLLHIEFIKVRLDEKVRASVPLEFTGEALAVREKRGVLLPILHEVEIEALPQEIPDKLSVSVAELDVNQELTVSVIVPPSGVTILTETDRTVVRAVPLVSRESEKDTAVSAAQPTETAPSPAEETQSAK